MGIRCPKCESNNPDNQIFCGNCRTLLGTTKDSSLTKTLKKPIPSETVAGKYKILSELGRGGMGIVCKAEDTNLKRTVSLKFLHSELTNNDAAKARFIREAQAASVLDHPNICTIFEVDETDDTQMYISMAC